MTKESKEMSAEEIVNELHRLISELLDIAKAAKRIAEVEQRIDALEKDLATITSLVDEKGI